VRKLFILLVSVLLISCSSGVRNAGERVITVSIAPYKYFVEAIGGKDFTVNVMVPPGADPHIYEPYPRQIVSLRKSVAYISNGYMGFESTWMDRFTETNRQMKVLSLNRNIEPLGESHHSESGHAEGFDPHYWVSPRCALEMANSVRDLLAELYPGHKQEYEQSCRDLESAIDEMDKKAEKLFAGFRGKPFMIFHPNLSYLARDYGLVEIPLEYEGKEPPPSRVKELIDIAREDSIKTILVQREFDTKNARAIAGEIGAKVVIIDPLSEDWMDSTNDIINDLYNTLTESSN
jgi:zinc transport system substrate-binding protein